MAILIIAKGTYIEGLSRAAARLIGPHAHPPNLKVYEEDLTGRSHIYHAGVLNTTSPSQGYVLGANSVSRKGKQNHIPSRGEEVRSLQVPRSSSQVNQQSHLFYHVPLYLLCSQSEFLLWEIAVSLLLKPLLAGFSVIYSQK